MIRKLITYIISLLCIIALPACSDIIYMDNIADRDTDNELPVEFVFNLPDIPDSPESRTVPNPKLKFTKGDVIHVQGTFTTEINNIVGTVIRYGALQYDGRIWSGAEGSGLKWPNTAISGNFIAYYIAGSTGNLQPGASTNIVNFSNITPQTDPLKAENNDNTAYGKAIKMDFNHILAYLTLTQLEPQVATEFMFTQQPSTLVESNTPVSFHNAYQLSLNDDNTLNFKYLAQADENYTLNNEGLVYIKSQAIHIESDNGQIAEASYFLEPAFYESFILRYPTSTTTYVDYMQYDYNRVLQNNSHSGLAKPDLKGGHSYVLNIAKSPGTEILVKPDADSWDESDETYDIDVIEFMKAVVNKEEYKNDDGVLILQQTATGVLLLHNVDFKYKYYDNDSLGMEPSISGGNVFDGGLHYIWNIGCPLIKNNFGTIQNLGIKKAKINVTANQDADDVKDTSRQGALCKWNQTTGIINNVKVADTITMNVDIQSESPDDVFSLGTVIGSNTGTVSEMELNGRFSLTAKAYTGEGYTDNIDASVLLGGVIGQNPGSVSHINTYNEKFTMTITNNCAGNRGAYYVGGVVGQSQGFINDVTIVSVSIDGSASRGLVSYMGGIAGSLDSSSESTVTKCNIGGTGSVKAGISNSYGNLQGASYTGGVAGALQNVSVTDCNTTIAIAGPVTAIDNVIYGTGGVFGRIRLSPAGTFNNDKISDITSSGSSLTGPAQYIGNFAGIVPEGQSWETDYRDKKIRVNEFTGYQYIGYNLN